MRSRGFPSLHKIRVFAPGFFSHHRSSDSSEDEIDAEALERKARQNGSAAPYFGLNPSQYGFRMCAYLQVRNPRGKASRTNNSWALGSFEQNLAEEWRRTCDIPISCQQIEWLWTREVKAASISEDEGIGSTLQEVEDA